MKRVKSDCVPTDQELRRLYKKEWAELLLWANGADMREYFKPRTFYKKRVGFYYYGFDIGHAVPDDVKKRIQTLGRYS